jgi:hypothetical protein
MSNLKSSIPLQEFNSKYASEDDSTDSEDVFELDSNFDQFTVRFSNALSEMLANENDVDVKMEAYKGEFDSDIKAELEQVNIEQNFDNNQEERDEIIPNNTDNRFASKLNVQASISPLTPCVIIDNIQGTIK